jgi:solute carrier family 25 phosphate transporter 3
LKDELRSSSSGEQASLQATNASASDHHHAPSFLEPPPEDPAYLAHDHMTAADVAVVSLFCAAAAATFGWIVRWSGPGAWRFYLAGGICAAVSHVIPVPIDVVKTRKQVDPEYIDTHFVSATKRIIQTEGVKTLFGGLGPTAWGYLLEGSVKFGVYEVLKPVTRRLLATAASVTGRDFLYSKLLGFSIAAAVSGVAASVMLTPMEALRIRCVASPKFADLGWVRGGYKMMQKEGVYALSKGFVPMLCKQVPYTVTKNVSFDLITKATYRALRRQGHVVGHTTKIAVPFVSAMAASVLSCITSQPGDMVLSVANAQEGDHRPLSEIVKAIRQDRGLGGFFVGMKTRFLHVGIIVTLQLLIYDWVKRMCGIAATGL